MQLAKSTLFFLAHSAVRTHLLSPYASVTTPVKHLRRDAETRRNEAEAIDQRSAEKTGVSAVRLDCSVGRTRRSPPR